MTERFEVEAQRRAKESSRRENKTFDVNWASSADEKNTKEALEDGELTVNMRTKNVRAKMSSAVCSTLDRSKTSIRQASLLLSLTADEEATTVSTRVPGLSPSTIRRALSKIRLFTSNHVAGTLAKCKVNVIHRPPPLPRRNVD